LVQAAYAAIVTGQVRLVATLNAEIERLGDGGGRALWPTPGR
jgi:hypothetical protein